MKRIPQTDHAWPSDLASWPRGVVMAGIMVIGVGNAGVWGACRGRGMGGGVWWCGDGSGGRGERGRFGLAVLR